MMAPMQSPLQSAGFDAASTRCMVTTAPRLFTSTDGFTPSAVPFAASDDESTYLETLKPAMMVAVVALVLASVFGGVSPFAPVVNATTSPGVGAAIVTAEESLTEPGFTTTDPW